MAKVKSNLVRLTDPLTTRRYDATKMYNVGMVAFKSIDGINRPLVSGWVQLDWDDSGNEVWNVKVAYTYNPDVPAASRKFHQHIEPQQFDNLKTAVKFVEGEVRSCYATAVERGLAAAVGEALD